VGNEKGRRRRRGRGRDKEVGGRGKGRPFLGLLNIGELGEEKQWVSYTKRVKRGGEKGSW